MNYTYFRGWIKIHLEKQKMKNESAHPEISKKVA